MRRSQRKLRLMTGVASLIFFIAASLCFGFALQGQENANLLGFHINEDAVSLLNLLPFFNTKAESNALYPIGNVENQVILVNTGISSSPWLNDEKIKTADQLLNTSLAQYVSDVSKGTVKLHSVFYGYQDSGAKDGYTLSQPLSYYIESPQQQALREAELLREIVEKIDESGSMANKTTAELDTNQDGYIDNITFLLRGNKQDEYNLLWPHQFALKDSPKISCMDGELAVHDYIVVLSGDDENEDPIGRTGIFAKRVDLGVIAHELLHVYGFPDMYHNYKYENDDFVSLESNERKGDPLGQWDIMDNTITDLPQNPLYYTNYTYSPWAEQLSDPLMITKSTQNVELKQLDYTKEGTMAAIIKVDVGINVKAEDEYFMVEYRKRSGWDEKLPGSGLIVYRINLAANYKNPEKAIVKYCSNRNNGRLTHCGNMFGPSDEVYIFRPGITSINAAENGTTHDLGLFDAALSSDHGAQNSLGRSLSEVPGYSSDTLADTIYFSDGSNSGIVISNVSDTNGDTITFDVTLPEAAR